MQKSQALKELIALAVENKPLTKIKRYHDTYPRGGSEMAPGTEEFYIYQAAFDYLRDRKVFFTESEKINLYKQADLYELTRLI